MKSSRPGVQNSILRSEIILLKKELLRKQIELLYFQELETQDDVTTDDTAVEDILKAYELATLLVGPIAAVDAIHFSIEHRLVPPEWFIQEISSALLSTSKVNPLRRLKAILKHLDRYDKVTDINEINDKESGFYIAEKSLSNERKAIGIESIRKSFFEIRTRINESKINADMFWVLDRIGQKYIND